MSDVHILVIREPGEERLQATQWEPSWTEQLNYSAVGLLVSVFPNTYEMLTAPVVFAVQDEPGRTIRFTSTEPRHLQRIAAASEAAGLEVVTGPVQRPDPAAERLEREISHMSWRYLEIKAKEPGIAEEVMQLVQAALGRKELELTAYVRTWDADRIRNRLHNIHLASSETRILKQALAEAERQ